MTEPPRTPDAWAGVAPMYAAHCQTQAMWCRAFGWDAMAREWTRLADFWRSR